MERIEEALLTRDEVDFLANLSAFMAELEVDGGKGESDGSALSELSTST